MKTFIISDIKKDASMIPYALNLCKHTESEVEIIHTIDTRIQQGVTTQFADSQTISPGEKLSRDNLFEREKKQSARKLDQILSREASRLNYPLKINTLIEMGSIESKLIERVKKYPDSLVIANKDPDNYFFDSYNELLNVLCELKNLSLLVPANYPFKEFEKVLIITDFSGEELVDYTPVFNFLNQFSPLVSAIDMDYHNFPGKEVKSQGWLKTARDMMPELKVTTAVLDKHKKDNALSDYMDRNKPDLIVVFKQKQNFLKRIFTRNNDEKLVQQVNRPFMIRPLDK